MNKLKLSLLLAVVLIPSTLSIASIDKTTLGLDSTINNNDDYNEMIDEIDLFANVIGTEICKSEQLITCKYTTNNTELLIIESYFNSNATLETKQFMNKKYLLFPEEKPQPVNFPGDGGIKHYFLTEKVFSL